MQKISRCTYCINDLLWVFYILDIDFKSFPRNSLGGLRTIAEEMKSL